MPAVGRCLHSVSGLRKVEQNKPADLAFRRSVNVCLLTYAVQSLEGVRVMRYSN